MAQNLERRVLRVRRKLRGAGPFLLAATILALVLGPRAPAAADLDEATTLAPVAPPVVEEAAAPAPEAVAPEAVAPEAPAPDPEALTAELRLGTRLTALGVMRLPPNPAIVAAVEGDAPTHLLWPVEVGNFGRGFGFTRAGRPELAHLGVDVNAPSGSLVRAAADGLVVYAGDGIDGFGNFIVIVHPNGWGTSYAHNSEMSVRVGQQVERGETIALVGQTGLAHGPHVHFEFYRRGAPDDPTPLFEGAPPNVERMVAHAALVERLHPHHGR